jgi:NAD(P)-dependent dehydrogenase (short-subunit alcohol dehydrogenase family)
VSFGAEAVRELAPARLFSLAGRVALVTGAGGGIGRWLAAGLAAAGASVVLHDLADEPLAPVVEALDAAGVVTAIVLADLADEAAPDAIVGGALERFGRLDVLVNCAAINRRKPIDEVTVEDWDAVVGVDLRAPYFVAQAAARAMRGRGGGAIVNVGSVNARYGLEQVSIYGPAKAALAQATQVMAVEWAQDGIRVNCIHPGFFDTPLAEPIWTSPDRRRWLLNRVPLERPGRPDELVGTCLLLASDAGSFVTGQSFVVDGGFLAGGRWFTPDRF